MLNIWYVCGSLYISDIYIVCIVSIGAFRLSTYLQLRRCWKMLVKCCRVCVRRGTEETCWVYLPLVPHPRSQRRRGSSRRLAWRRCDDADVVAGSTCHWAEKERGREAEGERDRWLPMPDSSFPSLTWSPDSRCCCCTRCPAAAWPACQTHPAAMMAVAPPPRNARCSRVAPRHRRCPRHSPHDAGTDHVVVQTHKRTCPLWE